MPGQAGGEGKPGFSQAADRENTGIPCDAEFTEPACRRAGFPLRGGGSRG